jgi:nitrate reductase NapAB chaperone NapD
MKEIAIIAEIDEDGKLHVEIEGTEGDECLDYLAFIKDIPGLVLIEQEHRDTPRNTTVSNTQRLN